MLLRSDGARNEFSPASETRVPQFTDQVLTTPFPLVVYKA
jgi:hypothetical protein